MRIDRKASQNGWPFLFPGESWFRRYRHGYDPGRLADCSTRSGCSRDLTAMGNPVFSGRKLECPSRTHIGRLHQRAARPVFGLTGLSRSPHCGRSPMSAPTRPAGLQSRHLPQKLFSVRLGSRKWRRGQNIPMSENFTAPNKSPHTG